MASEIRVSIASDADTVTARQRGRDLAIELGFSRTEATFIATAISEIARNITTHAGEGEMILTPIEQKDREGIMVIARDQGPGISDVAAVLNQDQRSHGGLGLGLWGARRLMDDVRVVSEPGKGTTVTMKKWRGFDEVLSLLGG